MYELKCNTAGLTLDEDNSVLFCIQRNNNATDWNIRQIDLSADQVFNVTKIGSNVCYTLFSQAVDVDGASIAKHDCKKQTSASIEVTNTSSKPCKIIQVYK